MERWAECLNKESQDSASFLHSLAKVKSRFQQAVMAAKSRDEIADAVLRAQGAEHALAELERMLTAPAQEERAYATYRSHAGLDTES